MKRLAALALALLLCGCAGTAALGPVLSGVEGQIPGQAAGLFGIPAATISQQMISEIAGLQGVAAQFQMLRAQLDGNLPIMPTPPIINPIPTPVTPPPGPPVVINPGGGTVVVNPMPPGPIQPPTPVPVPSLRQRHAALDRQSVDQAIYDHTPAKGTRPSGVADKIGQPGTLTPPNDLRSLFGPDGHLKPAVMMQNNSL